MSLGAKSELYEGWLDIFKLIFCNNSWVWWAMYHVGQWQPYSTCQDVCDGWRHITLLKWHNTDQEKRYCHFMGTRSGYHCIIQEYHCHNFTGSRYNLKFLPPWSSALYFLHSSFFDCGDEMMKLTFVPRNDLVNEVMFIKMVKMKRRETEHKSCCFKLLI